MQLLNVTYPIFPNYDYIKRSIMVEGNFSGVKTTVSRRDVVACINYRPLAFSIELRTAHYWLLLLAMLTSEVFSLSWIEWIFDSMKWFSWRFFFTKRGKDDTVFSWSNCDHFGNSLLSCIEFEKGHSEPNRNKIHIQNNCLFFKKSVYALQKRESTFNSNHYLILLKIFEWYFFSRFGVVSKHMVIVLSEK